ncbi:MAG TPA: exodeoxyribonuclease III [Cytophagaceae bacterium]|jgi:exodeoxyribonuclease-3|nr:exodeoxyribonuclease III [Cytophagaceae bacterium]
MKIITYNVNGLRAAVRKGFVEWMIATDADVICLQEIKASPDQLDLELFHQYGYKTYWHPAVKKGYSGVATFSRVEPENYCIGCGIEKYDFEGRVLRLDFKDFSLMNVYMPSGSSGEIRQGFKFEWMNDFFAYINELRKEHPNLVICGDFNICHQAIDIHNPKSNANSSGFLPAEREWMGKFLDNGFIDTFRHFNKEPHNYTWWSHRMGARSRNLGWRIDYHTVTKAMEGRLKRSVILNEAKHSDHCPVLLEIL